MIGAVVKLAGRIVAPFAGQNAVVKAIHGDRWIVIVSLPSGERREIGVAPQDTILITPPQKPSE